uniref:C-type lectin domain-containing protein n=1 Tax=Xiphophorus maculatus TaxID=8083 RepID=A0A3B5QZT6_XIPMA
VSMFSLYICVISLDALAPESIHTQKHCDLASGWRQHGSNCYKFKSETMKSWSAARHDCVEEGGDLVSISSLEENTFVMGTLSSTHLDFWIGLHNPTVGGYSWSDGTPLSHTNWGHGEPNNHEGREECVEMVSSNNGTFSWWNDLNCDARSRLCLQEVPWRRPHTSSPHTTLGGQLSCR